MLEAPSVVGDGRRKTPHATYIEGEIGVSAEKHAPSRNITLS